MSALTRLRAPLQVSYCERATQQFRPLISQSRQQTSPDRISERYVKMHRPVTVDSDNLVRRQTQSALLLQVRKQLHR
ncbi:hypothetical protein J6590_008361 [Homalodisca vitripennis]|nr:hypothetical protein J6590_008361 [Homalodisca vitripennis]